MDASTQGSLGKGNRYMGKQVVTFALKNLMRRYVNENVQIASWAAMYTSLAFTR